MYICVSCKVFDFGSLKVHLMVIRLKSAKITWKLVAHRVNGVKLFSRGQVQCMHCALGISQGINSQREYDGIRYTFLKCHLKQPYPSFSKYMSNILTEDNLAKPMNGNVGLGDKRSM